MHPLSDQILQWYEQNGRDLPWRLTRDPYQIWLSEIILQQTRVEQGMPYFYKFIEYYPDIQSLAMAEDEEVFKLWEGLGYYNRCRNMLATARHIVTDLDGVFPDNYNDLLSLKGIGPYTAAAISSIVFGESQLAIDGNLKRVLSRYYGIFDEQNSSQAQAEFFKIGQSLLENADAGTLNQALMDIGANVCTPKNPKCDVCPINSGCYARENDAISELPVKKKAAAKKNRYMHYRVLEDGDKLWIRNRKEEDIWQNLHEFWLVHDRLEEPNTKYQVAEEMTHILSHRKLHISTEYRRETDTTILPEDGFWVEKTELDKYAFPVPLAAIIKKIKNAEELD